MAGILDEIAAFLQKEQAPNPQLLGRHPSDNADMSALQLAPHMAKGLINDVARYGKQAVTGEVSDTELLPQQPLTGQAKTIADSAGSAMGSVLNYKVPSLTRGSVSLMDDIGSVVNAYESVRPHLVDAIGEPNVNRGEGAGLLASMVIPGKVRAGVGRSKDRVGTTGQYVGGPAGMDTEDKLALMYKKYIDDVKLGAGGRNWYNDSSEFIDAVSPDGMRQSVADITGVTSQGTGVDSNLGFAIKGINQRAAGLPVETGRFPNNQSPLIEQALDNVRENLGPKRQPFADNLSVSWNPGMADTPVHDIWQGRAMGYKHPPSAKFPDGKPWDAGFSPQQHSFMDDSMVEIQDQLNSAKALGYSDWDALNTQAAAWSGAKIRAGDITEADAAKHYGDFADKYAVNATYEQAPGANTAQLDGILDLPFEDRLAFENAATWQNSRGLDDIYSSGGLLTQPTNTMVGAYTPQATGILEINPGQVARPLVQQAGGEIIPSSAGLLDIAESSRAFIDVQNAGAYHKVIPDSQTKMGERSSINLAMDKSPEPELMSDISSLADEYGFFAVDTGNGVNFVNDIYSPIGAERTGGTLGKELKGDLGSRLDALVGSKGTRVKVQAGYEDYEAAWQAGEGSGKATTQFLDRLDENPTFAVAIEPALKRKAAANIERDAGSSFKGRKDIQRARKILSDKGIDGLKAALAAGTILPAIAMVVLDPSILTASRQPDDSQREST
jgi:hypothetical protein